LKVPHAVQIIAVCTTMNVVVYRLRQLFIDNVAYQFRDRLGNLYRQSRDKNNESGLLFVSTVKVSAEHLHNFSLTTIRLCFFAYISHIFLLLVKF
jgi:hypothetical protein